MNSNSPVRHSRHGHARRALAAGFTLALALALAACGNKITDQSVLRIQTTDMAARVEASSRGRVMIIDSRNATQFAAGHIPGAVNVRLPDLRKERWETELRKRNTLIVYGQNPGSASAIAMAKRLMEMGMKDVRLYERGFDEWRDAGLTVARGD